MHITIEYILAFLLVAGGVFAFIGSFGLAKLDDFYMRLHGPTKATTLGLGCILAASSVYFSVTGDGLSLHEVLITSFLFITAPVSAHLLAKTALAKDFDYVSEQPDPLDHVLNVSTAEAEAAARFSDAGNEEE
jgi:multicomponent K+:H+ antiporter subunit G